MKKPKQIRASNTCYNKHYIGKVRSVVAKGAKLSVAFKYIEGKGNPCHCGL